ncbi:hypothetical protein NQD34_018349 [Periophthalmus magnuspinnatus]|nr:hypothetical protein NQD34_018203 [Periophthalmus magnuspinnatus]KAI9999609.1 hypothetical protein NQD34_018349 [Periophthalmus magnuspinnatus]
MTLTSLKENTWPQIFQSLIFSRVRRDRVEKLSLKQKHLRSKIKITIGTILDTLRQTSDFDKSSVQNETWGFVDLKGFQQVFDWSVSRVLRLAAVGTGWLSETEYSTWLSASQTD